MDCTVQDINTLGNYKYVVILSSYNGQILLSRHKSRTTWETQGGHIEPGEAPLDAAKRELYEESGAIDYKLVPLFDYSAGDSNGMVFFAQIKALANLPQSEMAETHLFDALPQNLTYPAMTPKLFAHAAQHFV